MIIKIGFLGGGRAFDSCLEMLSNQDNIEVKLVHNRYLESDNINTENKNCRYFSNKTDINSEQFIEYCKFISIDLLVSINCKQIFKKSILNIPKFGVINIHNGLLPKQRGGGGAFTGVLNKENLGITVHYVDEDIDSGDIILQNEYVLPEDNNLSNFLDYSSNITPILLNNAIDQILLGKVHATSQKQLKYHYTPNKSHWDELIDWSESTEMIYNKFRARNPGPKNFYLLDKKRIFVTGMEKEPLLLDFYGTVGQVLKNKKHKGVLVKTGDSGIWITEIQKENDDKKITPNHKIGTMLTLNLVYEVIELHKKLDLIINNN